MPDSSQADDGMAHFGALVPTNHAEAAYQLATSRSTRANKVTQSDILREAMAEYLARQDDLPQEARDLLDDDLLANAGGEEKPTA